MAPASWWRASGARAITTSCALPFERLEAVGLPAPRVRAFAHHRRAPVVRPRSHHAAARHPARPHHAVDVQQGRRPLSATGGERLARPDQPFARGRSWIWRWATCACTFPRVRDAKLVKAHVVKEQRATFSAAPDTEALRPGAQTALPNLFLAGDWTRTGWPATMEGAVRSGYIAAEAVTEPRAKPGSFCCRMWRKTNGASSVMYSPGARRRTSVVLVSPNSPLTTYRLR